MKNTLYALGWSLATLKRRLQGGRELLRARLARRGLALPAALSATLLLGNTAGARVPASPGVDPGLGS